MANAKSPLKAVDIQHGAKSLMGEARLTEQGSGKTADYSQSILILTSNAHAE